jgi:hypothetical protein
MDVFRDRSTAGPSRSPRSCPPSHLWNMRSSSRQQRCRAAMSPPSTAAGATATCLPRQFRDGASASACACCCAHCGPVACLDRCPEACPSGERCGAGTGATLGDTVALAPPTGGGEEMRIPDSIHSIGVGPGESAPAEAAEAHDPAEAAAALDRRSVRWFPAEPARRALYRLARDRRVPLTHLARLVALDRRTIQRLARRDRLRVDAADRIAVALGRHPCELWPTWFGPAPRDQL